MNHASLGGHWPLLVAAAFSLAVAILFALVGRKVLQRPVADEARLPLALFSVWWFALAGQTSISAVTNIVAATGRLSLPLYGAITYLNLFLICVALWGLLYYLVYLYTGKRNAIYPLALFYILYYATILYYLDLHNPIGVTIGEWSARLEYETPLQDKAFTNVLLILLVAPQILAAFAYSLLYFKVEGRTQRYRIALVSWAIIIWFGSALVASFTGLSDLYAWPLVSRLISFGAALIILAAFQPPRWIQRRWRIEIEPLRSDQGVPVRP